MRYRTFPKMPDLPVSVLGFGCMRLPVLGGNPTRIDEEKATALLHQAVDRGVNYVDTAVPYHGGESEPFVGRALKGGYREKVRLATKLPVWDVREEADWERILDGQLQRLDTDHIDFYMLHALDAERWGTVRRLNGLKAMEKALADGRIRHLGFSFHGSPSAFDEILDAWAWHFCQLQVNFVDVDYQAGVRGMRRAAERGVGVISMEPLRGGALAVEPPPPVQAVWARSATPRRPAEWALRWVWNNPEVVTALSGMNSEEQLLQNLAAGDAAEAGSMSAEELALVAEVRAFFAARTQVPCTTCGYCMPCPSGVAIPDVFSLVNTRAMFDARKGAAGLYDYLLLRAGKGADQCVDCGTCAPHCPQGIAIPERLREAHGLLTSLD